MSTEPKSKAPDQVDGFVLRVLGAVRRFIRETMDLQWEAQIDSTMEIIRKDMVFRGHVVWVLVCSILIASIGLNVNSPAVIIGAMLISPLMGPILATGMAVGTNDMALLRRALRNFMVMVGVGLITSTVYFLVSPFSDQQSELLARTRPTLLDAGVAIFGGIAGIIGVSRRNRGNVIPGVAIATALMPPLCTAGYGLATMKLSFLFGALYLFLLNSIFISLSTFFIVRLLKFPMAKHVDPIRERKVRVYMAISIVLLLAPSAWVLVKVTKEAMFKRDVTQFLNANFPVEGTELLNSKITLEEGRRRIDLYLMGDALPEAAVTLLEKQLLERRLSDVELVLHQSNAASYEVTSKLAQEMKSGIIQDLFERNEQMLREKDERIQELEHQVDAIPMDALVRELRVLYPGVQRFSYANAVEWDGSQMDTIPTAFVNWSPVLEEREVHEQELVLQDWLRERLGKPEIRLVRSDPVKAREVDR